VAPAVWSLRGNTPTKQQSQSRNFVIERYSVSKLLITNVIVRSCNKCLNCCLLKRKPVQAFPIRHVAKPPNTFVTTEKTSFSWWPIKGTTVWLL